VGRGGICRRGGNSRNGDVYDCGGFYGERGVVYGRMVNGVVVPV